MKQGVYLHVAAIVASSVIAHAEPGQPLVTSVPELVRKDANPATKIGQAPFIDDSPYSDYVPKVETYSQYVTADGQAQSWVDKSQTADIPVTITSTVNGQPTTKPESKGVKLEQVTKAAAGAEVGDWNAIFTPEMITKIENTIGQHCSLTATKRSIFARSVPSCKTFAANPTALTDALWQPVRDVVFAELGIDISATQAGTAALVGAATIVTTELLLHRAKQVFESDAPKGSIFSWTAPKAKVDEAVKQAETATPTTMTSASSCPKATGIKQLICKADACKAPDNVSKCTVDNVKNCPCVNPIAWGGDNPGLTPQIMNAYQDALSHMAAEPDSATTSATTTTAPPSTTSTTTASATPTACERYELDVHQWMEYTNSYVEWTVRCLANNQQVLGPDRGPTIGANGAGGIPVSLWVKVDYPTNKDKTNIEFGYNKGSIVQTSWTTGSTGDYDDTTQKPKDQVAASGANQNYCLGIEPDMWKAINAGFQRDIRCFFQGQPPTG